MLRLELAGSTDMIGEASGAGACLAVQTRPGLHVENQVLVGCERLDALVHAVPSSSSSSSSNSQAIRKGKESARSVQASGKSQG